MQHGNSLGGSPLSSTFLVRSATNGDGDAFRRLVEPYLAVALRASTLVLGSEAEAADAVQDALLSAWQDLSKLREPEAFGTWFRKIVVRSAMRRAKARRRLVALDLTTAAPTGELDRMVEARGWNGSSMVWIRTTVWRSRCDICGTCQRARSPAFGASRRER